MTLEEMELAACEKLPNNVIMGLFGGHGNVMWDTEGLQVCHEAEKLLDKTALDLYNGTLRLIVFGPQGESPKDYSYPAQACIWNATYEQRLEALCRVWFPERFNETQNLSVDCLGGCHGGILR